MGKTIGIIAVKGGVGKTTISSSIATDLANHHGKKVLLVDGNYSAPNLGLHMDIIEPFKTIHDVLSDRARIKSAIHTRYGVDVIPGDYRPTKRINPFKLKSRIDSIKDEYDFVIIDSSPSLNDEILSTMLAADSLFVVTTPDYPTLSCSLRAAALASERGKPIAGLIINKVRDPAYELSLEEIEQGVCIPVVARLPDDVIHTRSLFTRIPAPLYKRNSKFSKEITKLNAALIGAKAERSFLHNLFRLNFKKEEVNRELLRQTFYRSFLTD